MASSTLVKIFFSQTCDLIILDLIKQAVTTARVQEKILYWYIRSSKICCWRISYRNFRTIVFLLAILFISFEFWFNAKDLKVLIWGNCHVYYCAQLYRKLAKTQMEADSFRGVIKRSLSASAERFQSQLLRCTLVVLFVVHRWPTWRWTENRGHVPVRSVWLSRQLHPIVASECGPDGRRSRSQQYWPVRLTGRTHSEPKLNVQKESQR